ncbi:MAG: glycosyltransferase family 2 protein [Candidatus Eiseniibacteriota bacterium]
MDTPLAAPRQAPPAPAEAPARDSGALREAPELSIVIPAYNERENVVPLFDELREALARVGRSHEIVMVDDGSRDGTGEWLVREAARDPRVRPVLLAGNHGQSAAIAAGLGHARGAVIVTLDADLQNDPADLPRLLAALESADVVSGIRARRHDDWLRRISSRIANGVRRRVLGDPLTDIGCSFKAYRREALEGIPMFSGAHRFLPALCFFRGARLVEVPLSHRPRRHGISKYGVSNRLWRGLYDLIGVRWLKSRMLRYREREPR